MKQNNIGIIGLAVMGANLARNMERNGFNVAVYNRSKDKVESFMADYGAGKNFDPYHDLSSFVQSLERPRKVMLMIKSGTPVDATIEQLLPYLEADDIIIDGGNSNYEDTERRLKELSQKGIHFVGTGISGGEEGALNGPSIMPGGDERAKLQVLPIFQKIAAKAPDGEPCCYWVGKGGSGHFVKMIHNGIEYGDMQLISECYLLMKKNLNLDNEELSQVFADWNKSKLNSYLIEITSEILKRKDSKGEGYVIDKILDAAGQKGTGKWSVINSMEFGIPLNLIATAVYERSLSSKVELRKEVSDAYALHVIPYSFKSDAVKKIEDALYASKLVSYAQGFQLMREASDTYGWELNLVDIAKLWRAGCIIRSTFLNKIAEAYTKAPDLKHLLLDEFFRNEVTEALDGWREAVAVAVLSGVTLPACSSALNYFYSLTTERLSANMLQAQRDYFGAHTFERVDEPRGVFFHEDWSDLGSNIFSTTYNV